MPSAARERERESNTEMLISVKAYYGGEIRRFQADASGAGALRRALLSSFSVPPSAAAELQLSYADDAAEWVTLASDEDFAIAVSLLPPKAPLRLRLSGAGTADGESYHANPYSTPTIALYHWCAPIVARADTVLRGGPTAAESEGAGIHRRTRERNDPEAHFRHHGAGHASSGGKIDGPERHEVLREGKLRRW